MRGIGFVFLCLALFACRGKKEGEKTKEGFSYQEFSGLFKKLPLPYVVTDTGFAKNRDTTVLRSAEFAHLVPDSLTSKWFGKGNRVQYIAIGKLPDEKDRSYYLVKASSKNKKMVLVLAFRGKEFGNAMPVLNPDADPTTSQTGIIDAQFSIQRNTVRRKDNNTKEGREVYEYDPASNRFQLILINPLDVNPEVVNPIDTFSRRHKWSGDYVKDKQNFVSIRDGRTSSQLQVYIHLDKDNGACTGELKGTLFVTSSNTAVYRQGGDPCVLTFRFTSGSVTVQEDQGCGNHRGIDCLFNGSFQKKKEARPKKSSKKK